MSKNFTTSSAVQNLSQLCWNGFNLAVAGTSWAKLTAPTFSVQQISTIKAAGIPGTRKVRFTLTSGIIPAWCKVGAAVTIAALVDAQDVGAGSNGYVVTKIDSASGLYFEAASNRTFTEDWTLQDLDSAGTVTLDVSYQRAMLKVLTGASSAVNIAAGVDCNLANPVGTEAIAVGSEYPLEVPVGVKTDLTDLYVSGATGATSLSIRFL